MQSQQPDNQKNLLAAIILSMGVLLGWQYFYAGPKMKEEQERLQRAKLEQVQKAPAATAAPSAPGMPAPTVPGAPGAAVAANPAGGLPREAALKLTSRIAIATPSLTGSITLKGGRIDDLTLVKYRETVVPTSPNVVLFSPFESEHPYFAEHGWLAPAGVQAKLPDSETTWTQQGSGGLTHTSPVTLVWDNGQGLLFRRTISVDANYMFNIADEVENKTASEVALSSYARIYRFGMPKVEGFYIQHEGLIGVPGDAGLQEVTYADAVKKDDLKRSFEGKTGGWIGITDKYWASAILPPPEATYNAVMYGKAKSAATPERFYVDYAIAPVKAMPGQKAQVVSNLFAGAKQVGLMEGYETTLKAKQFSYMVDWGWFYFITKPLFHLINWLYRFLGNFGLATLAVTVIVKAAFFPLANKAYESMAKMKKLQPEMEKLRERFKDDKAAQQKALMELYSKQKINPLAGCLPIALQIPVFFALYKVLFITIDMRHAPFYGWIKDLSAPDPTSIFNLFGLLPYAVPDFLHIGAWPIIMGITMWLQMQLNPQQPDPTQQMVFNWMPVMFTFMLGNFASGLVIYWAWNNILSLAQQYFIMKKQGADVPLIDNIRKQTAPLMRLVGMARRRN